MKMRMLSEFFTQEQSYTWQTIKALHRITGQQSIIHISEILAGTVMALEERDAMIAPGENNANVSTAGITDIESEPTVNSSAAGSSATIPPGEGESSTTNQGTRTAEPTAKTSHSLPSTSLAMPSMMSLSTPTSVNSTGTCCEYFNTGSYIYFALFLEELSVIFFHYCYFWLEFELFTIPFFKLAI